MIVLRTIYVLAAVAVCVSTGVASASAPPVGKLPKASLTTVHALTKGETPKVYKAIEYKVVVR